MVSLLLEEHKKLAEEIIKNKKGILLDIWQIKKNGYNYTLCKVKCEANHTRDISINNLKNGFWCRECASKATDDRIKKSIEEVINNKNGTLLKCEKKNKQRCLTISCNIDNNIWTCTIDAIQRGQWCMKCYHRSKITKSTIKNVLDNLKSHNLELLTSNINDLTYKSKIKIRCQKHNLEWEVNFSSVAHGNCGKCKLCSLNIESYKFVCDFIESKNYKLLKWMIPGKSAKRLLLRCEKHNHEWRVSWGRLKNNDNICYYCAFEFRKTSYKKIKDLVKSKGGTLLTENCTGSLTKIMVRCDRDLHEWETYYDNINQGYWCPKCPWIQQTKLFEIIKELFVDQVITYNARPFKWLKIKINLK